MPPWAIIGMRWSVSRSAIIRRPSSLRDAGGADNLMEAEKLFSGLNGYQDSEDQRQKTVYLLGESYLADKLYDKAMESFQSLGDYEDSPATLPAVRL